MHCPFYKVNTFVCDNVRVTCTVSEQCAFVLSATASLGLQNFRTDVSDKSKAVERERSVPDGERNVEYDCMLFGG